VAILDADKEGFLRSARSLIQTFGRAARNVSGTVILYADRETPSMRLAIGETDRRRQIQSEYNQTHHIVPQSIQKSITAIFDSVYAENAPLVELIAEPTVDYGPVEKLESTIKALQKEMQKASRDLEFERAIELRDRIKVLKRKMMFEG
jgi:excinuclease ABC subunit B